MTLAISAASASTAATLAVRSTPKPLRPELLLRSIAGIAGGLVGVGLYDAIRLSLVAGFGLHVRPLEALPLFGALIAGTNPQSKVSWIVGWTYHYTNGMTFGLSYGVAFGRRPWFWGIPFALGLEALMLSLYPGWLHIGAATLEEFTLVSLSGHLAYGCGLGLIASTILRRMHP
jgi:hypothetical protein